VVPEYQGTLAVLLAAAIRFQIIRLFSGIFIWDRTVYQCTYGIALRNPINIVLN
jgi:hypothetical protein